MGDPWPYVRLIDQRLPEHKDIFLLMLGDHRHGKLVGLYPMGRVLRDKASSVSVICWAVLVTSGCRPIPFDGHPLFDE